MRKFSILLLLLASCMSAQKTSTPLAFDHVWIVVAPGAPERAALERAGLMIAPTVSEHEGQGTASVTMEFENAFLELLWPDPNVPVSPGMERGAEKFRQRMLWRTSGWCPIGIGFRRTRPDPLPLATWSVAPPWLPPGAAIEILTPRGDTKSPSLFISPRELAMTPAPEVLRHRIGVKRITAVRLIAPDGYEPVEALAYVRDAGLVQVDRGEGWLVEVTFDGGARSATRDFRPELPLRIRY